MYGCVRAWLRAGMVVREIQVQAPMGTNVVKSHAQPDSDSKPASLKQSTTPQPTTLLKHASWPRMRLGSTPNPTIRPFNHSTIQPFNHLTI
jgi:hypothetical protein